MSETRRDSSPTGDQGGRQPGRLERVRGVLSGLRNPGQGHEVRLEAPSAPEPSLLPHEDIIFTARRRMTAIYDGEKAALDQVRQAGSSTGAVSSLETRVKNVDRKIAANEKIIGNWETFCTNARRLKTLAVLHDDVLLSRHNKLADRYSELVGLKGDKKTWYRLPRERQQEYTAEMALLKTQIAKFVSHMEGLVEEAKAIPEPDKYFTDRIAQVKALQDANAALDTAEDELKANPEDASKKRALEAARKVVKEARKAFNSSSGEVDEVRIQAEYELCDAYLNGGLYEGLDREIDERREGLLRDVEPELNASDVLPANHELPDFLRRESSPATPSGRRHLVPEPAVEERTGPPPRADRRPAAPASRRSEQRSDVPVPPVVRLQEQGRARAAVSPVQRASWEINYNIPPFKPSGWEGAARYAAEQLMGGLEPVTVEHPDILLSEAKDVLARMSAGILSPDDVQIIRQNRIFRDPRYSDELRADLVAAWAQGTEVFGKNLIMRALGRVMYLMGGIGDIQTPDVFRTNRFLRPIRKALDFIGEKGISPDDFKYRGVQRGEELDEGEEEEIADLEDAPEHPSKGRATANIVEALGKYNRGEQLSRTEIAALDGVNFQWPKGRPGAEPARARGQQTPPRLVVPAVNRGESSVRGPLPARQGEQRVAPSTAPAVPERAQPAGRQEQRVSSSPSAYAIELIGKVASGAPLTEGEEKYLDTDRTFLGDPMLQKAYMRAVSMRQIRSEIATSQPLTSDDIRFLEEDRQLLKDPIFKAAYDQARRGGIRAAR